MKCPNCSAPLMIEDAYCRYCGTENPYFKQHREDLQDFTEEFEETHQEVLQKVQRSSHIAANVLIILVLIILNLVVLWCTYTAWDFAYAYEKWYTNQHAPEIRTTIETYVANEDIIGLGYYLSELRLYDTDLYDYEMVELTASEYTDIHDDIAALAYLTDPDDLEEISALCAAISSNLSYYYQFSTQYNYSDPACFTDEHKATIALITAQLEVMLEAYMNIPAQDIPALMELSESRRAVELEERWLAQ